MDFTHSRASKVHLQINEIISNVCILGKYDSLARFVAPYCHFRPFFAVGAYIELFECINRSLYSIGDYARIGRDLLGASRDIRTLYCVISPQLTCALFRAIICESLRDGRNSDLARIEVVGRIRDLITCLSGFYLTFAGTTLIGMCQIDSGTYDATILAAAFCGAYHVDSTIVRQLDCELSPVCEGFQFIQLANQVKCEHRLNAQVIKDCTPRSPVYMPVPIRANSIANYELCIPRETQSAYYLYDDDAEHQPHEGRKSRHIFPPSKKIASGEEYTYWDDSGFDELLLATHAIQKCDLC